MQTGMDRCWAGEANRLVWTGVGQVELPAEKGLGPGSLRGSSWTWHHTVLLLSYLLYIRFHLPHTPNWGFLLVLNWHHWSSVDITTGCFVGGVISS